ncbi:MAG: zeta toxin family protein [Bosea sp. (in: a-proteobacteria)]
MTLPEERPFVVIIAGPNGSGKSTLTKTLMVAGVDFGEYINPDEIAATLEGSYDARVQKAQTIADDRREACVRESRSFTFETVMSHPSKIELLRAAHTAGFFVQMYFVAVDDPLINVSRVANRVAKGGHDVPPDKIVERYHRVLQLAPTAISICDRAVIFDNSRILVPAFYTRLTHQTFEIYSDFQLIAGQFIFPAWIYDLHSRLMAEYSRTNPPARKLIIGSRFHDQA